MDDGRADDETGEIAWPSETARYRIALPATEDGVALDVLAAVLDASPRPPAAAEFEIDAGRRVDGDRTRSALADLAAHPDVTVGTDETAGAVPLTGDTFAALADLSADTRLLIVRDEAGDAVLVRRAETITFALPASLIEGLRSDLPASVRDRIDPVED